MKRDTDEERDKNEKREMREERDTHTTQHSYIIQLDVFKINFAKYIT